MTDTPTPPRVPQPTAADPAAGEVPAALTDFVDRQTLQEIQDAFTSLTQLRAIILDGAGAPVTQPTDTAQRFASDLAFEQLIDVVVGDAEADPDSNNPAEDEPRFVAPISVAGVQIGAIAIEPGPAQADPQRLDVLEHLAHDLALDPVQKAELRDGAELAFGANRGAAINFLYLIANAITRQCYEQHQSGQRVRELSVLYETSRAVAGHENLDQVLTNAVDSVRQAMQVKAAVIRLLHDTNDGPELRREASTGLSDDYLQKGRLLVNRSEMLPAALAGEVIHIDNMPTDPRVFFPQQAADEGLASMLCVGIIYEGNALGTLQLFTDTPRRFDAFETDLVGAIAQLLATAIEKKRLDQTRSENRAILRQLHLAASVQQRMLPDAPPPVEGYDLCARYVPSYELSGDFYDFIELGEQGETLGIAIGDVVGKGVAASLMMAGARASLRAFAQDVYDLDEVVSRVNVNLARDTTVGEFVTLWYGTLEPQSGRLTYCSAGHEPGLLVRGDTIHRLDAGGMIAGIDADQDYEKGIWDLEPGDLLLLHTDGLSDAMNAQGKRLGRKPIDRVLLDAAAQGLPACDVVNNLLSIVHEHSGDARKTDDTTLVVLRRE